jgi:hypothetical protein
VREEIEIEDELRIRTLTFNETRLADAATDDVILVA